VHNAICQDGTRTNALARDKHPIGAHPDIPVHCAQYCDASRPAAAAAMRRWRSSACSSPGLSPACGLVCVYRNLGESRERAWCEGMPGGSTSHHEHVRQGRDANCLKTVQHAWLIFERRPVPRTTVKPSESMAALSFGSC
jgi:hypothetical protein